MDKHTLVQYSGGGYDGCIWEWNYFYIDSQGEFHDIMSSGHAGCDTIEKAKALLADESETKHIYDVTDNEEFEDFCKSSAPQNVFGVFRWFWKHDVDEDLFEPFFVCSDCDEHITEEDEGILTEYGEELLCYDCYSIGTCSACSEYVGQNGFEYEQGVDDCSEDTQAALEDYDQNNGPVCEYCWENERDSLIGDEREDVRQLAWAKGTPDLFSDELRWFWIGS